MRKIIYILAGLTLLAAACNKQSAPTSVPNNQSNPITMTISSPAFKNNESIPAKYTCDGENVNLPLNFSGVPAQAKSLAMLMDDPDVPKNLKPDGVFDHWTIFNIPSTASGISENSTPPGVQGKNGAGASKYTGP